MEEQDSSFWSFIEIMYKYVSTTCCWQISNWFKNKGEKRELSLHFILWIKPSLRLVTWRELWLGVPKLIFVTSKLFSARPREQQLMHLLLCSNFTGSLQIIYRQKINKSVTFYPGYFVSRHARSISRTMDASINSKGTNKT